MSIICENTNIFWKFRCKIGLSIRMKKCINLVAPKQISSLSTFILTEYHYLPTGTRAIRNIKFTELVWLGDSYEGIILHLLDHSHVPAVNKAIVLQVKEDLTISQVANPFDKRNSANMGRKIRLLPFSLADIFRSVPTKFSVRARNSFIWREFGTCLILGYLS